MGKTWHIPSCSGPTEGTTQFPLKYTSRVQSLPAAFIASITSPYPLFPITSHCIRHTGVENILQNSSMTPQTSYSCITLQSKNTRRGPFSLGSKGTAPLCINISVCISREVPLVSSWDINRVINTSKVGRKHHNTTADPTESVGVVTCAQVCKPEQSACHQPSRHLGEMQASRGKISHCLISHLMSYLAMHKAGCYLTFQKVKIIFRNIRKPQLIIQLLAVLSSGRVSESELPHVTIDFIVTAQNADAVLEEAVGFF